MHQQQQQHRRHRQPLIRRLTTTERGPLVYHGKMPICGIRHQTISKRAQASAADLIAFSPNKHVKSAATGTGTLGNPNYTNRLQPQSPCKTKRAFLQRIDDCHGSRELPRWQQRAEASNPPTQGATACSPTSSPNDTRHTNKQPNEHNYSAVHGQQSL